MEPKYTKADIETFFTKSKNIPNYYGLEKVKQLLNNPNAKPMQKVKFNYSPLKLIYMNSILLLLLASVLFIWKGNENNQSVADNSQKLIPHEQTTPLIKPVEIKEIKRDDNNVLADNKDINNNRQAISNDTNKIEYKVAVNKTTKNDTITPKTIGHYFFNLPIDSTIFKSDKITLLMNKSSKNAPELLLFDNHNFILQYNSQIDTIKTKDPYTGQLINMYMDRLIKIVGRYYFIGVKRSSNDHSEKYIIFTLNNGKEYKFKMLEELDKATLEKVN